MSSCGKERFGQPIVSHRAGAFGFDEPLRGDAAGTRLSSGLSVTPGSIGAPRRGPRRRRRQPTTTIFRIGPTFSGPAISRLRARRTARGPGPSGPAACFQQAPWRIRSRSLRHRRSNLEPRPQLAVPGGETACAVCGAAHSARARGASCVRTAAGNPRETMTRAARISALRRPSSAVRET